MIDPEGNANSHDGRTIRTDVRARSERAVRAMAKRPKDQHPREIYCCGMERVAYVLAEALGLPAKETYLEEFAGFPCSIQLRIPEFRSWIQAGPMMKGDVKNREVFAKAALFDVWLANVDRRDVNIGLEPMPPGTTPGKASGSRLWLIDHGACGLWPADKLAEGRDPDDIPAAAVDVDGTLWDRAELVIAALMPPEYRMALKQTLGDDRDQLLDVVHSVGDDAIREAVMEVPDVYMSEGQREATVTFLASRLSLLDTVLKQYW